MESHARRIKLYAGRNWLLARPYVTFTLSILVFAFAYSRLVETRAFGFFLTTTARVTSFLLNLTGLNATVAGNTISAADFSVTVGTGCDGLVSSMIFVAAVLAYPSALKAKAIAIPLGMLSLYAINIIRMASLFYIGSYLHGFFQTAHLLVWQSITILAAVVLWLFWVRRTGHAEAH